MKKIISVISVLLLLTIAGCSAHDHYCNQSQREKLSEMKGVPGDAVEELWDDMKLDPDGYGLN